MMCYANHSMMTNNPMMHPAMPAQVFMQQQPLQQNMTQGPAATQMMPMMLPNQNGPHVIGAIGPGGSISLDPNYMDQQSCKRQRTDTGNNGPNGNGPNGMYPMQQQQQQQQQQFVYLPANFQ